MTHPPTAARRGRHAPLAPPACCGWVPGSLRRRDAMAGSPPISTQGGTLSAVLFDMDGTLVAGDDHHVRWAGGCDGLGGVAEWGGGP